ncbi:uncharacterized protein LOC143601384 [Bidens hawaiensis]|uniref:uncharacterized protein LOC143601384 n=1 Tax=Bidens hawaiensis TaxID=980011 RepID=UPI00404B422E
MVFLLDKINIALDAITTAARPTWAPAKGGNEQGGTRIFGPSQKYSSRDIASHTTLIPRKEGQDTQEELERRDLREELEERERRRFSSKDDSDDDSDEDDDDEDDEEALMAELELIRKERTEEKRRQEREELEEELKRKEAETIRGNPLLNNPTSFNVKRRWDDDVVFKNQARGETKAPKRFMNGTIRSDFHRKFLHYKYMN